VTLPGVGTNRFGYSASDPVNFADPGGNLFGPGDLFGAGGFFDNAFGGGNRNTYDAGGGLRGGQSDWAAYQLAAYQNGGTLSFDQFEADTGVDLRDGLSGGSGGSIVFSGKSISAPGGRALGLLPFLDFLALGREVANALPRGQFKFVTYILRHKTLGRYYYGRTSGYGDAWSIAMRRYHNHHLRGRYDFLSVDVAVVRGPVARDAIRGREQQLIDRGGGVGSYNVGNIIRGVSRLNRRGFSFWEASNALFGNIAPFTGYFRF